MKIFQIYWKNEKLFLTIDRKKTKIKLDMKYVFYLMWECANESVGIEMWKIQVQEEHEVDDYRQWALYLNNSDGTSTVNVARTDRAVGVAVNLWSDWGGNEEENSEVKTDDATQWWKMPNSQPNTNGNPDNQVDNDIPTVKDWTWTTTDSGLGEI